MTSRTKSGVGNAHANCEGQCPLDWLNPLFSQQELDHVNTSTATRKRDIHRVSHWYVTRHCMRKLIKEIGQILSAQKTANVRGIETRDQVPCNRIRCHERRRALVCIVARRRYILGPSDEKKRFEEWQTV